MEQFFNSTIRFGNEKLIKSDGADVVLKPSGQTGDWSFTFRVNFSRPFGAPVLGKPKDVAQEISVILTPRRPDGVPVVAVVINVDSKGFTFRVRNADPSHEASNISVDWLAVLGVPDSNPTAARGIDGRLSVLQPKHFSGFQDTNNWPRIWFSTPMVPLPLGAPPFVLLTQNDLHCSHDNVPATIGMVGDLEGADQLLADHIIDGISDYGFSVRTTNMDTIGGSCGFYAAAFVESDPELANDGFPLQQLWLDHGSEKHVDSYFKDAIFSGTPYPVAPGGQNGDWRSLDIYFDRPFLTPPLVFATARGGTPLVCIAQNVTTHGFTIAARNTDTVDGHALFHWAAIGCANGCG